MRIVMLSISHRTAPVALRERIAVGADRLDDALRSFRSQYPAVETVLISTCNRTELYIARPTHEPPTFEQLDQFLAGLSGVDAAQITAAAVHRDQEQAVAHLFRVATGLESMVLGEPQILGQVKRAYETASSLQTVGPVLHRVFQQAIAVAKQVRGESGIDEGRVSVGSVAVDFASQIFERFDDKVMAAIGAGDMAKLTLRHLQKLRPAKLWLTNRSRDRAEALATKMNLGGDAGGVRPFDELDQLLIEADIVLTSTGATEPIITAKRFKPIIRRRRMRPIFIVDIAVPRDVEPAVGNLGNVYLYNIDDLQRVVAKTYESRSAQVEQCERLIFDSVRSCLASVQHRDIGHLIRMLREQLHHHGDAERRRTLRKLAATAPDELAETLDRVLEEHDHRLVNKILHMPLSQLDQNNPDAPLGFYAAALRHLFGLHEGDGARAATPPTTDEKADPDASASAEQPHDPARVRQSR